MTNRVLVTKAAIGRQTAWKVVCSICELTVWPCRAKRTAVGLANRHAAEAHAGKAVVAIAKA